MNLRASLRRSDAQRVIEEDGASDSAQRQSAKITPTKHGPARARHEESVAAITGTPTMGSIEVTRRGFRQSVVPRARARPTKNECKQRKWNDLPVLSSAKPVESAVLRR